MKQKLIELIGTILLVTSLAACAPAATVANTATPATAAADTTKAAEVAPVATATSAPAATAATFTDPFAYCQAVGNADTPGPEFTGEKMTETLAQAVKKASGASADAPLDLFMKGSTWRCMDGKVYGCFVGANLPCDSKANTDATPTKEEQDFCTTNPNSDSIPAAVTGHDTVFAWSCKDGKPESGKQIVEVDARGYVASIWYALPAP